MNLMALTLVGLASMPRLLNFGRDTEHTLGRVELPFEFPEIFKCFGEIRNELIITFCLDDAVINIGFGVAPDLPLEASLNGLLVGGAGILEAEHHGVVAVGPEGVMKDVFSRYDSCGAIWWNPE